MLFSKLLPRDGNFFELIRSHGALITQGARAFQSMVHQYSDPAARERFAREVDAAEKAADRVTAETNKLLHKTFITPIDREQIHKLISTMDDVLDMLQDSAEVMQLYNVGRVNEDIVMLADVSTRCCERVQQAVELLPNLSKPSTAESALRTCEEIDQLEGDADRALRSAMSRLFRESIDVRELIKLKEVYERLESITDRCQDVANVIEGIVLENS